jgi:hypothetical protein
MFLFIHRSSVPDHRNRNRTTVDDEKRITVDDLGEVRKQGRYYDIVRRLD